MVSVNVEIALGLDRQVEQRVTGQGLEHVIEEADPGADMCLALPVEVDQHVQVGLFGRPPNLSLPGWCRSAFSAKNPLQCRRRGLHIVRGANGNPEAIRKVGRGRHVANEDAIFLEQPPEHLLRGHALAPDQDEVGRAGIERESRDSLDPLDEPLPSLDDLGRASRQQLPMAKHRAPRPRGSPG